MSKKRNKVNLPAIIDAHAASNGMSFNAESHLTALMVESDNLMAAGQAYAEHIRSLLGFADGKATLVLHAQALQKLPKEQGGGTSGARFKALRTIVYKATKGAESIAVDKSTKLPHISKTGKSRGANAGKGSKSDKADSITLADIESDLKALVKGMEKETVVQTILHLAKAVNVTTEELHTVTASIK